jgi:D-alanyl-D-alanine endopeptidase (penicillin-binding protein 7)
MTNTVFEDPSGLGRNNLSTAQDLAILVSTAYEHPKISNTSASKYFKVEVKNKRKITYMTVGNTNCQLLEVFDSITLSKTGYTNPAGRCLVVLVEKNNKRYAITRENIGSGTDMYEDFRKTNWSEWHPVTGIIKYKGLLCYIVNFGFAYPVVYMPVEDFNGPDDVRY